MSTRKLRTTANAAMVMRIDTLALSRRVPDVVARPRVSRKQVVKGWLIHRRVGV